MAFIISPSWLTGGPTTARILPSVSPNNNALFSISSSSSTIARTTTSTTTSLRVVHSFSDVLVSPESIYGPINADTPEWLRTVVWSDFRLAVTFFVVCPLILLIWSAWECRPAGRKMMIITSTNTRQQEQDKSLAADAALRIISGYWQASALLLITVLLNITATPIGAVTGAVAQLMIYISLNWWESLNLEATHNSGANNSRSMVIGNLFGPWRTITSWVAGVGVAVQLPFLPCGAKPTDQFVTDPYCAAWLEPPRTAASLLLAGIMDEEESSLSLLGHINDLAMLTLAIYVVYLVYYVTVPLQEIGRSGRANRSSFTFVDGWKMLGFLKDDSSLKK